MARKVDLDKIYVGFETQYAFDPYTNQEGVIGYQKALLEDTGYYLESDSTKASLKLKKMGIDKTSLKVRKIFYDLVSGIDVNLDLDLDLYPKRIVYNTEDSTIEMLVSIKEMVDEFFTHVALSEYDEKYYRYFIEVFKYKEMVDLDYIFDYLVEIESLYNDYMGYIAQTEEETYKSKDKDKTDNSKLIELSKRR